MILHLSKLDKFIPPFIDFVANNFDDFESRHIFYVSGESSIYNLKERSNVIRAIKFHPFTRYATLLKLMYDAEKIILHGLWDFRVVQLLAAQPWLLKKCYWIIWGGDLYVYKTMRHGIRRWYREFFRRIVIKKVGFLITGTPGDVDFAREWYGASGEHIVSFSYSSNIYTPINIEKKEHSSINILVGNSANPTNNHIRIFDKLGPFGGKEIKIYAPLSYGDEVYAKRIIEEGYRRFGDKFIPLTDFMELEKYKDLLSQIDIAVFDHERQQAYGNTINILGMGKTVYMNSNTTTWATLRGLGLHIFSIRDFRLDKLSPEQCEDNKRIILKYFSKNTLVSQLNELFNGRTPSVM